MWVVGYAGCQVPDIIQDDVGMASGVKLPLGVRPVLRIPDPEHQRGWPKAFGKLRLPALRVRQDHEDPEPQGVSEELRPPSLHRGELHERQLEVRVPR